MKTSITLDLRKTGQKYLNITYHISDLTDKNLVLNFPSWAPGSYLLREYQGHVEDIAMRDSQGRIVKHEKLNKNQWKFQNIKTKSVTLTYRLYANDLSVRGAYADHELVCVTPCTAFFYPDKKQGLNLSLKIQLPSGWKLALAKKTTKEIYSFKSFDDFFDTPLLAAKDLIIKQFKTQNTNYKMAFWGTCFTDINKIVEDVKKAVAKQNSLFRENPCKEYLFQVIFTSNVKAGTACVLLIFLMVPRLTLTNNTKNSWHCFHTNTFTSGMLSASNLVSLINTITLKKCIQKTFGWLRASRAIMMTTACSGQAFIQKRIISLSFLILSQNSKSTRLPK